VKGSKTSGRSLPSDNSSKKGESDRSAKMAGPLRRLSLRWWDVRHRRSRSMRPACACPVETEPDASPLHSPPFPGAWGR